MHIQRAMLAVTATLLNRLWVEYGDNGLPGRMIWESNDDCIEVIRTGRVPGEYDIRIHVGNKVIKMIYDESLRETEDEGISLYVFGDATDADVMVAGGLVMLYYKTAMQS